MKRLFSLENFLITLSTLMLLIGAAGCEVEVDEGPIEDSVEELDD
ncbi:MAG: hypothetical protein Fues2KO_34290 [Fuerstiella sp.]